MARVGDRRDSGQRAGHPAGLQITEDKDGQLTGRTARRRVVRVMVPSDGLAGGVAARADLLATEEPLGIRLDGSALTVTMRTPGDDVELAAGFLAGEAVVCSPDDIAEIRLCGGTPCGHGDHEGMGNIADVLLAPGVEVGSGVRRNFMTTSACGVCGRTSIEDVCVRPAWTSS
jgi:FdhD protein